MRKCCDVGWTNGVEDLFWCSLLVEINVLVGICTFWINFNVSQSILKYFLCYLVFLINSSFYDVSKRVCGLWVTHPPEISVKILGNHAENFRPISDLVPVWVTDLAEYSARSVTLTHLRIIIISSHSLYHFLEAPSFFKFRWTST